MSQYQLFHFLYLDVVALYPKSCFLNSALSVLSSTKFRRSDSSVPCKALKRFFNIFPQRLCQLVWFIRNVKLFVIVGLFLQMRRDTCSSSRKISTSQVFIFCRASSRITARIESNHQEAFRPKEGVYIQGGNTNSIWLYFSLRLSCHQLIRSFRIHSWYFNVKAMHYLSCTKQSSGGWSSKCQYLSDMEAYSCLWNVL